ncbi:MAG: cobalamin-dependent protein [Defluviitaleaceae bacterium]|nr:cobalamin-dependent protein [Defluviitaleaceae bacterium]
MKVLLIRPKPHKDTIGLQNVMICEPLELEYLSSNAEAKGHKVDIIDMIIEKKQISYFVKKYNPDVVGITGYIAHVNIIKGYAREIKECNSNIKIIVGGVHAEVNPEDFVCNEIDYIIRANGIRTFIEILDKLKKKSTIDMDSIYSENVKSCKKDNTFHYLYPDREKVNKYRSKYYYMFHRNCSLIKTSFGCPYDCKFCFCRQITDGNYFYRELNDIIRELKSIKEQEVYIVDDDFLVDKDRIQGFCELLKEHNVDKKYLIYARADFIANNEDIIELFKSVGLRAVIVGLESCDSKELVDYNKKTKVVTNEKAVRILQKYDIECYGTFILGLEWVKKDFNALSKWIKKLGLVFVNLQPLTPLKRTELYEKYKSDFIISEDKYEKWDLAHLVVKPTNISVRKYYLYTIWLYYSATINPKAAWYMIRKYGVNDTIKLSIGAFKVNIQYFKKLVEG